MLNVWAMKNQESESTCCRGVHPKKTVESGKDKIRNEHIKGNQRVVPIKEKSSNPA